MDDPKLLADAKRLNPHALAAIHDRYYPDLYRYLLYRTSNEAVAEDLASDVFMRLLEALHTGRALEALRPWLFGVANHLVADHFRQLARRPQAELSDEFPAAEDGPDVEASLSLTGDAVRLAMRQLTDEQRRVLALRFGEGRTVAGTAILMRKSVTAVKQLQFRAIAALRRQLEGLQ